ncbi:MAG TPA: acyl-CoA dehydrogenase family protein [Candidatus Bathyarchaeia archaeon]|nr:acyl-CoA dehydrogenase family protein [Candidatus Bathyarchaeia archaeon]
MDFSFTPELEMLRKAMQDFAKRELLPRAQQLDESGEFPRDIIKKIADLGVIGIVFPPEYGGSNMGHLARMISIEELSRAYASIGLFLQASPLGLWVLLHFGTEEQKKKYIPPVISGEQIMCMAVTEPSGGSDPSAIGTKAKLEGNHYIVNGSKCFITNGGIADTCVFMAKTGEGAKGFSVFAVEKGTAGFEPGMREMHAGMRSMIVSELVFKNCRIPKENLIGNEGDGLRASLKTVAEIGRTGNTGVALGIARAAYETTLQYAKEKQLYGKPIAEIQTIKFMLADMHMQTEAAKLLAYQAAWLLDQGKTGRDIAKEIASAKAYSSEVARRNAIKAIQIHGAYGTLPEFNLMRYLRDSLEAISAGGTNEIMRTVIGREITK